MSTERTPPTPAVRPLAIDKHPLMHRAYRVATPAIEAFYQLVQRCLRHRIPGAMIHGRPRLGKAYAIEYVRLLLAREGVKIPTFHVQSHHNASHAEGAFFAGLLRAVGYPEPEQGRNSQKRARLNDRIREAAGLKQSSQAVLFCDEAQRYNYNEYEWLRDVHDDLAMHNVRLTTFLVGQPKLITQKQAFQTRGEEQIVARFMVEELRFRGVTSAEDTATCLAGYDKTEYPERSGWTFTRFFFPKAYDQGLRLADQAHAIWNAFADAHVAARLAGPLEIPMEYFTRTVEIGLIESIGIDKPDFRFNPDLWRFAVMHCGYLTAQNASHKVSDEPS